MEVTMIKYIDAEKLKEQVEKRRKFHDDAIIFFCNSQTIKLIHGAGLKEDEEILALIDSLQKEQPEVDLEKELEDYARENPTEDAGSYRNLMNIARHFYNLGFNARKDK